MAAAAKTFTLELEPGVPAAPHNGRIIENRVNGMGGQVHILWAALTHFIVVCVFGRSFGKTATALLLFWEEFARFKGPGNVYDFAYCGPTRANHAVKVYRKWKEIFAPIITWHSDVELTLHIEANGKKAILDFWGLDEHDNLRGARKHRIVVDECKDVAQEAFGSTLMPMTLGREGKILLIGTPGRYGKGNTWFKDAFDKGVKREDGYYSITAPSHDNPYLTSQEIRDLIAARPDEKAVEEEIYARWLADDGAVFSNLRATFSLKPIATFRWTGSAFVPDHERPNLWVSTTPDKGDKFRRADSYCAGLDFGIKDPTVWSCFNRRTAAQAAVARFSGHTDYTDIIPALDRLMDDWNTPFVVYDEGGGHGGAAREYLARHYKQGVTGRKWSHVSKVADITRAQMFCSLAGRDGGWALIDVPWQKREFEEFQVTTVTKQGIHLDRPRFSAPPKKNDDGVTAACLAATAISAGQAERPIKQPPAYGTHDYWDAMLARQSGRGRKVVRAVGWAFRKARR